ncbi:MAG: recombination protein O N-terminal domain-containing protein [Patescibacteria group bacterium]
MNTYYQTPAIVLTMRDEREADRIITFYTRDFGKIKTLARGVRHIKSKLRGHIVPGALVRIAFVEGKESLHLVDGEILYNPLRKLSPTTFSPSAPSYGAYFKGEITRDSPLRVRGTRDTQVSLVGVTIAQAIHFLDRVTGERERDEELWRFLMHWFLEPKENFLAFQASTLSILGFLPRDTKISEQQIHAALAANHLT